MTTIARKVGNDKRQKRDIAENDDRKHDEQRSSGKQYENLEEKCASLCDGGSAVQFLDLEKRCKNLCHNVII